ncbi:Rv3235 family protein [Leifsonia xyli]|uniref:Rv3235 family protein n=1 Tax=Leifsonia xyli TaxID=1575 RepID=UPI003D67488C
MQHPAPAPATLTVLRPAASPAPPSGADRADDLAPIVDSGNPDAATLCANLARCVIEVLAGARPLDQLGRWVSDSVYVHLLRRTMLGVRARAVTAENPLRPRMRIGEPRLSHPSEDVVEAVVLVHQSGRSRAVAIRLERHRARWRATAINVL